MEWSKGTFSAASFLINKSAVSLHSVSDEVSLMMPISSTFGMSLTGLASGIEGPVGDLAWESLTFSRVEHNLESTVSLCTGLSSSLIVTSLPVCLTGWSSHTEFLKLSVKSSGASFPCTKDVSLKLTFSQFLFSFLLWISESKSSVAGTHCCWLTCAVGPSLGIVENSFKRDAKLSDCVWPSTGVDDGSFFSPSLSFSSSSSRSLTFPSSWGNCRMNFWTSGTWTMTRSCPSSSSERRSKQVSIKWSPKLKNTKKQKFL